MAGTASYTPWTCLVLVLALLNMSVLAAAMNVDAALAPRQSPNANALISPICQNYAQVANRSVVGLNSTYRAAFLRSSPMGTDAASSILDTQSPKFMGLMMDVNLNQQCGNLSEIAFAGAAANFTNGIVADFTILEAPGIGVTGPTMPLVIIAIVLIMGGTFISL
ncbi:hypothetical protein JX265_010885 [Neoarthrinium moseri]|uniref:Uncharacterized protein n=1 Tax=Neoarthrinium moseri TaxID=1658444 RepID=A0A9P9WDD6_9PEZI|nr:uncharacterized protein JN550_009004 [Neoarthrinium moseri]KAI1846298.1 hypothetical protein JX266_007503 [Neoarthrinium moseri]KAI1858217.1 hypothetical protein JX265_010885 [Neoarthrinium moseri]KAI1864447.1 hypothetical protein JN550_009004 [Neoarthrinium moseri]